MRKSLLAGAICFLGASSVSFALPLPWNGYAGNAQHTADSLTASQPLQAIHWQTTVDPNPEFSGNDLLIHYGSPVITANNTVIVPVKTRSNSFQIEGLDGNAGGSVKWIQSTDYTLPPTGQGANYSNWIPSYSPTLALGNTLYYPGAGGTVYKRTSLDSNGSVTPTQLAFYGSANYQANQAAYNAGVGISTPITSDTAGNIYFGYQTTDNAPGGLQNGIARISNTGVGTFFQANQLQVNNAPAGLSQVATNCAPALSNDGSTVYVTMSTGNFGTGRLVALNSTTLTPTASVALQDPRTGDAALVPNEGTASPMVGPDGDVYMGVYDRNGTSRGWMEHYSSDLQTTKTPGGFGWDDTASVVPASMVPSYHGTSTYLLMTKYNNYADPGTGGDGHNRIAILDPNDTEIDTRPNSNPGGQGTAPGATIMKVVESVLGPIADDRFDPNQFPGAVHEWCINTAVVDPATDSVLVNSEDGNLYRWDLATNQLSEQVTITSGLGEAYTPTEIGPDGTVYAINNATLFAVGAVPEPGSLGILTASTLVLINRRRARR